MQPNPRRADADDAAEVTATLLRSRRASTPGIPLPVHSDEEVGAWFADVVLPTRETWVVDAVNGGIAALLVLEPGWIDQLYVDPDHLGRGLGSCLVELAKATSPDGLDLWTFQANARARRFYEHHGFVAVGTTDGDNEEGAPDVRYRWRRGG